MLEQREPEEELMLALRSRRPYEHLLLKDQWLLRVYVRGKITFGMANVRGWSL